MPTDSRFFRRWAVQRLPWDRMRRGSILSSYIVTLLWILLWPFGAGKRVVLPDRWGRALRWAGFHILMAAAVCALLSNRQYFARRLINAIWPDPFQPPHLYILKPAPLDYVAVWLTHSMAAWVVVLLSLPLLGSFLSMIGWRRHLAAKWAGVKWSLYCSAALWIPIASWYLFYFIHPPMDQSSLAAAFNIKLPPPSIPDALIVAVYSMWWGLGLSANPYSRIRSWAMGVLYGILFMAVWDALALLLFPSGSLGVLL